MHKRENCTHIEMWCGQPLDNEILGDPEMGACRKGSPRNIWEELVKADLKALNFLKDVTEDCIKWGEMIVQEKIY